MLRKKTNPKSFYDTELGEAELMAKIDNYLDQSIAAAEEVRRNGEYGKYIIPEMWRMIIGAFLKLLI